MKKASIPYKRLCTEFYNLDKPFAPADAIQYYLVHAAKNKGRILEPMCGTGRFLIPLLEKGYDITGFDYSPHMLGFCKKKCKEKGLKAFLYEASFENFHSSDLFSLIFIPSSSFCLLIDLIQAEFALKKIFDYLTVNGKFLFEVETVHAVNKKQGIWQSNWIDKPDGSILVGNFVSNFDQKSGIETMLCRYELWQNNSIVQTEVEDFRMRLYETNEIENLLEKQGFIIEKRTIPYTNETAVKDTHLILYECTKN